MWQEVQAYEKRIDAWVATKSSNAVVDHKGGGHDILNDTKQPPAVVQFEVY